MASALPVPMRRRHRSPGDHPSRRRPTAVSTAHCAMPSTARAAVGGARLLTGASRTPRLVGNQGPGTTMATSAATQASTTRPSCHSGAAKARRRA